MTTTATAPARALRDAVAASFADLPGRYLPDRAPDSPRRYRIRLDGFDPVTVVVHGGRCTVWPGAAGRVHAELRTDAASWLAMADGEQTGLDLFAAGLLEVVGELNEALRLETLLAPPPGSATAAGHARLRLRELPDGVRVETYEAGDPAAPPVLFLHGLGASKVSLLPAIAGLARTNRVIAVDFPGFGGSPAAPGAPYDAPWLASVARATLDSAGIDHAAVVGNSMGGRVAVELALAAPERVTALALLCPAVAFTEYTALRPLLRSTRLDVAVGALPWPLVGSLPRSAIDLGLRALFADSSRVPRANLVAARDDFVRQLRSQGNRMALTACSRRLGLEAPGQFWRRLATLQVPSLWVFGDKDRLVSAAYAPQVRRRLPDADVQVWRSCGHVPQFEHPRRTTDALHGFFGV